MPQWHRATLQLLHDAICAIRDAKLPDVKQIGSAGSFFKNPVIERAQFEVLQKDYPTIPQLRRAQWKGESASGLAH